MDDSWLAKCVASSPQMSSLLATEPGSQAVTSPHLTQAPATASAAEVSGVLCVGMLCLSGLGLLGSVILFGRIRI